MQTYICLIVFDSNLVCTLEFNTPEFLDPMSKRFIQAGEAEQEKGGGGGICCKITEETDKDPSCLCKYCIEKIAAEKSATDKLDEKDDSSLRGFFTVYSYLKIVDGVYVNKF